MPGFPQLGKKLKKKLKFERLFTHSEIRRIYLGRFGSLFKNKTLGAKGRQKSTQVPSQT
jgi:hypothetical protein